MLASILMFRFFFFLFSVSTFKAIARPGDPSAAASAAAYLEPSKKLVAVLFCDKLENVGCLELSFRIYLCFGFFCIS